MTRPTVLVVADQTTAGGGGPDVAALADLLGADTTIAVDAEEALARVVAFEFDLVTLPADPVGMCFHELARSIEDVCRTARVPAPPVWRLEATMLASGSPAVEPEQPSGDESAAAPAGPAIDLPTLTALEADIGDRGFVLDTVEVYLTELPERVAAIAAGLASGSPAEVKAVAHSLKSSSAMLGALRMATLCADLERQAAIGEGFDDTVGLAQRLTDEAATTEEGLRAYLAS